MTSIATASQQTNEGVSAPADQSALQKHFARFRRGIVGIDHIYEAGPEGRILYADWTASGRLYRPIEEFLLCSLGPYVANTHTESNLTGTTMTHAYDEAREIIKHHVNAGPGDALITAGQGMTTVVNKLQRMLGLRLHECWRSRVAVRPEERPLVLITHMEHHSNQTSWHECEVTVEIVRAGPDGTPDLDHMEELLRHYHDRPLKIGAFTACSNVTGIKTPIHRMAAIMHAHDGLCFVDYSASAPYVEIDMHPDDPAQKLDAIYFSPHKFLGGPGSSGVLVFDRALYCSGVPDHPGGGTVSWTTPWGRHRYYDDIEVREDGGTPGFLQAIRAALAIRVKEEMRVDKIAAREEHLTALLMQGLAAIPGVHLLEPEQTNRLCIVSFYVEGLHHNLLVRMLNDRFGVQTRGGCSCAGTYGHILLDVDDRQSSAITDKIDCGDLSDKPGWVRASLHPTNTDDEACALVEAVRQTVENAEDWAQDYSFDPASGEFLPLRDAPEMVSLSRFG